MALVVATVILGIATILTAWFLQPVSRRIGLLLRLSSLAEDLSTAATELHGEEKRISERVTRLLAEDQRKKQSTQATDWFGYVSNFRDWHRSFKDDFGNRSSNWNLFKCGCWQNYKLADEAKRKLDRARSLKEQGRNFTDEHVVSQLPEMAVVLKELQDNYESLSREIRTLDSLKVKKEVRVKDLISQNPEKAKSNQVGDWFSKVDSAVESSLETVKICETAMKSTCTKPLALNCSSEQDACAACKEKYSVGKKVNGLLREVNRLKELAPGFTDEQLIIAIPEMVVVLRDLQANSASLSRETESLKKLKADKEARAEGLVRQRQWTKASNGAMDWFREIESFEKSSSKASENYRLATISGSSCTKASSSKRAYASCASPAEACDDCVRKYSLGKKITGLRVQGRNLMEKGRRFTDIEQLVVCVPPDVVEQIPIDFQVFGQDEKLKEVLSKIKEEGVNKVGICGMGGIGKTTLLQRTNNAVGGFDFILYATAGRERDIARMQKEIGKRLRLSLSGDSADDADRILESLNSKNFLLLLDDLWEEIDLRKLGIPSANSVPVTRRKVVMTARDEKVCYDMGIKEENILRMDLLSPEHSWQLFCTHVDDEEVLRNPSIEPHARFMAERCDRLPLALMAVGVAMRSDKEVYQWKTDRLKLEKSAHEFPDIERKVLSPLKFSFDKLENDVLRQILFLCLFQPGRNAFLGSLTLAQIIVGEGLLPINESTVIHNWESALDNAQSLISSLLKSGLLMRGKKSTFTLHDCVYDMLVRVMEKNPHHQKMVDWISFSTQRLQTFFRRWEAAKRISMDYFNLREIQDNIEIPSCGDLISFSCYNSQIVRLPERFFETMLSLRVLMLTNSPIQELPRSIGSLANLKFLALAGTLIARLPEEMGNLQQLIVLCLENMEKLKHMPRECISRLYKLEELYMENNTEFKWSWDNSCSSGSESQQEVTLKDLKELAQRGALRCVTIILENDSKIMQGLSDSPELAASIFRLSFCLFIRCPTEVLLLSTMGKLEYVEFQGCLSNFQLESLHAKSRCAPNPFSRLRDVRFHHAPCIFNLAWLRYIPSLEIVGVALCEKLTMLLSSEEEGNHLGSESRPLPRLKKIIIIGCPQLGCIARYHLLFPSLLTLSISDCPRLKNLSLTEQNAPKLTKIKGSWEWWDGLEWERETIKSRFLPCFRSWVHK